MIQNKILIVDDEKAIITLMEQFFSRAGYEVRSAESGEDALELLQKDIIQVMFLDLNMPGMNGIELCRAIRKDMPMAMIFAVTGYASLFELSDCREAGFDDYFKKPIKIKTLIDAAENAFEKINRWKKT
ncbi:MAG: response regulator, partial [Thermodesulfobacteriota bacterium]|nr:response regulator [Thermodesulfobacteriota bacterium]